MAKNDEAQFDSKNDGEEGHVKIAELAREYTAEALQTLAFLMRYGKNDQVRLAAANALLDRGYGKPPAQVDVSAQSRVDVIFLTEAELRQALLDRGMPAGLLPPPLASEDENDSDKS
jgi:hypothetical protein